MLLAAIVLQASAVAFAPPLDAPLLVATERREGPRLYRSERVIRFLREGEGYRAEVTIRAASSATPDSSGALSQDAFSAFAGIPVTFHLDSAGVITGIDDLPTHWERFCRRVAEVAASRDTLSPADRAALAERIAAPFRALSPDRQRAMLASMVSAAIASEPMTPGTDTVHLSGNSVMPGAAPLDGLRTVVSMPGGQLRATTHASSASVDFERIVDMDPRTGLVARSSRTVKLRIGDTERVSVTVYTVAIAGN